MERGCCQGAPPLRLMRLHLLLLLLFLYLSVALKKRRRQHRDTGGLSMDVSCQNKYGSFGRRVACTWQPHNHSLGQGPFYLQFSDRFDIFSSLLCWLFPSPEARGLYSCVAEEDGEFTENDEYIVTLHTAFSSYPIFALYEPRLHIQSDAPTGLQSHVNTTKCRIQWDKPEDGKDFILEWQCQLEFKHDGEPWEQAKQKNVIIQESWVDIDGSELKCGGKYITRIRLKIPDKNTDYQGPWSPWSVPTHYVAPSDCGQKQPDPHILWTGLATLPFGLGALLFLLLALRFLWRLKDRVGAHTPTPATFFQPLYASHNGDFKGWVGLKGKAVCLSSNTEEDGLPGSSSHRGKGQIMEEPSSQISFLTPIFKAKAAPWDESCPPNRGDPIGVHPRGSKEANQEERSEPLSLLLPHGGLSGGPGALADMEGKGPPLSRPFFQELGPSWETEALFPCNNYYYCMWKEGSGSGAVPGGPCRAEGGSQPGMALGQG